MSESLGHAGAGSCGSSRGRPCVLQVLPPPVPGADRPIGEIACLHTLSRLSERALLEEAQHCVGLVLRGRLPMTDAVFAALPKLRHISMIGSGFDTVDTDAATRRGVLVSHNPGVGADAVVEYVLASILRLVRRFPEIETGFRRGGWSVRETLLGRGLGGLTLGVIGFGAIGSAVARAASSGLGMNVVVHDPTADDDEFQGQDVTRVEHLEDLLRSADAVTVHVPLNPSTRHLLNRRALEMMPRGSVLINASRGGVVDEEALLDALTSGRIAGAAVDVMRDEPNVAPNHYFARAPNVLLTPHVAGVTEQSLIHLYQATAHALAALLDGRRPRHVVNPAAWPPGAGPSTG